MSRLIKIAGWSGGPRASVIFVHGLGGHAYDTWRRAADNDTYWPLWLAKDLEGISAYTMAYEAPPTNWLGTSMPLQDRAVNVLELLLSEPGLTSGPITFICHSLGGLIVKQIVLDTATEGETPGSRRPLATRDPSCLRCDASYRCTASNLARPAEVFCVALVHRPDACRQ